MATIAAPKPVAQPGARDRLFYTGMAVALALTALIGFAPTYYLRLLAGTATSISGTPLSPIVHVHAALFTSWVVLFIVQTALVASRRVAVHRRLGVATALLALAMFLVGSMTAIERGRLGVTAPGVPPLAFLAIPLGDMLMFAIFIAGALWWRRDKETHKRLMLLAYIAIITAAVARLPGVLPHGPLAFYGLTMVFLVAAVVYDWVSRGRIHPAYLWGGTLLVLSVPGRLLLSGTSAWQSFAQWLISR